MKFKDYVKSYFISCGGLSVFLVCLDLIFNMFKEYLAPSLMECYIYVAIILYIAVLVEFIAKKNKKLYYLILNSIMFVLLVVGDIIRDVVRNRDIDFLGAIITSAIAVTLGTIARIAYSFYEKSRNKRMNQKLKEYQDNHED